MLLCLAVMTSCNGQGPTYFIILPFSSLCVEHQPSGEMYKRELLRTIVKACGTVERERDPWTLGDFRQCLIHVVADASAHESCT